jgi:hypothetical protein
MIPFKSNIQKKKQRRQRIRMVQFLEETTNDQKSKVLVRLGMTTNNLNNDISAIKSWIKTQPHLPETPSTY